MEPLSVTLLLPELIPVVILQGFDHIVLRLLGGEVFGDKGFQPFRLEADFLFLVWLLLTHDGENHVGVEPAVLGELFHLQCLGQGRRRLLGTDGIQQTVLFFLCQVGKLYRRPESDFPRIHQIKQGRNKVGETDVAGYLSCTL